MTTATRLTMLPLTVQTAGVIEAKVTVNPDEAVAVTGKESAPYCLASSWPKVIV